MALCEQCGSIQIVRARSGPVDKGIALLTGRRPFNCRRCGWRARRVWTDAELRNLTDLTFSEAAVPDPDLAVLDKPEESNGRRKRKRKSRRQPEQFDLSALELSADEVSAGEESAANVNADATPPLTPFPGRDERNRDIVTSRLRRSRRRQIVGTIALSALALCVFALAGLAGSCGPPSEL